MPFANHTPYDYFPRRLHPQEIGNPFRVINQFFGWENFPEWRNHLESWLDHALKSGYQMNSAHTLQTFVRYEFIEILLEGLFMIQRIPKGMWMPDIELYYSFKLHAEKAEKWSNKTINRVIGYTNNYYAPKTYGSADYELKYLSDEERMHPMAVVEALFEKFSLPHLRDALYWWLVVSMDYTSADDSRGDDYLIGIYSHLQKVVEAAHLIYTWNSEKWERLYP